MTSSLRVSDDQNSGADSARLNTVTMLPYLYLNDEMLQSVLGKEAPNECILQGQNVCEIGNLSENYSSVRRLDISFNALKTFKGIEQFPKLRDLSAYCCRLDDISNIGETSHLVSLLLQQNGITKFPNSFKSLKYLRELRVDRNQLSTIENLNSCTSLRILDISFNNLDSLSGLSGLQSLRELRANNNKIESLLTLKSLPSIRELQVSHNKLVNLDGLQHLPTLETIYADHNMITTVKISQTFTKKKNMSMKAIEQSTNNSLRLKSMTSAKNPGSLSSRVASSSKKDPSIPAVALLSLTDVYLSCNQITSLEGLNTLGTKIEVLDVDFNLIDLGKDKTSSIVLIVSSLRHLNELNVNKRRYIDNSTDLIAALFSGCPSLKLIDGETVTGDVRTEEQTGKEEGYEKNIHYDSDSDDSDTEINPTPSEQPTILSKKNGTQNSNSTSKRRVSVSGSATAIKEIAQIDDVTHLEGRFQKILSNCTETWTSFLRLTDTTGTSSALSSPIKPLKKTEIESKKGLKTKSSASNLLLIKSISGESNSKSEDILDNKEYINDNEITQVGSISCNLAEKEIEKEKNLNCMIPKLNIGIDVAVHPNPMNSSSIPPGIIFPLLSPNSQASSSSKELR